jgi:glycosyltransferase involved in cell wall biosynthesis
MVGSDRLASNGLPSIEIPPSNYEEQRLFVLPSYSENFGNTVLEAMRRGVPVVVTPEVGAAEIVRKSGAGLVVAGDLEPLGSAIHLLTTNPSIAHSMGEAGRQHAAAHFSWDHVVTQMEDLYTSLVSFSEND